MRDNTNSRKYEREQEQAAKYICNILDGLCPRVVEKWRCPVTCDLDTLPWQCWVRYFQERSVEADRGNYEEETVARAA